MKIIFCGSFVQYSAVVLEALIEAEGIEVVAVVTSPPVPMGRKKVMTPSEVQIIADKHEVAVLSPAELDEQSLGDLEALSGDVDFVVTAGYGKFLPNSWLEFAKYGALNLHFSLLPAYRGANPAEWAILMGETETGVSLITMSEGIDAGDIVAQARCEITPTDTRESLYERLYQLGADTLPAMLTTWYESLTAAAPELGLVAQPQPPESPTPVARRFIRAHGFVDWRALVAAMQDERYEPRWLSTHLKEVFSRLDLVNAEVAESSTLLERAVRALSGFPGVWTHVPLKNGKTRMKLLSAHLDTDRLVLDEVQLEGKTKTNYSAIMDQIV